MNRTHMRVPTKLESEPAEMKFFLGNGSVRVLFGDGTVWEVEDASEEKIPVSPSTVMERDKMAFFDDEMVPRIYYILLLRPYNKLGLARTYYNRKKNLARGRINKGINRLKSMGVLKTSEWKPIFEKEYGISPKSKHIYSSDIIKPMRTVLAGERDINPEMEFLVHLFDVFPVNEFFFEWDINGIDSKNVDVFKLFKIKILTLISWVKFLQAKNQDTWFPTAKNLSPGFLSIARKLGVLFQYIDAKPVADYLFEMLLSEMPPPMMDDLNALILHYMGTENLELLKMMVMWMFLPEDTVKEIMDKAMSI